jgi:hypothetical protein
MNEARWACDDNVETGLWMYTLYIYIFIYLFIYLYNFLCTYIVFLIKQIFLS